jgi:hypothetical protein
VRGLEPTLRQGRPPPLIIPLKNPFFEEDGGLARAHLKSRKPNEQPGCATLRPI